MPCVNLPASAGIAIAETACDNDDDILSKNPPNS
jgi:hypothetical protein